MLLLWPCFSCVASCECVVEAGEGFGGFEVGHGVDAAFFEVLHGPVEGLLVWGHGLEGRVVLFAGGGGFTPAPLLSLLLAESAA